MHIGAKNFTGIINTMNKVPGKILTEENSIIQPDWSQAIACCSSMQPMNEHFK